MGCSGHCKCTRSESNVLRLARAEMLASTRRGEREAPPLALVFLMRLIISAMPPRSPPDMPSTSSMISTCLATLSLACGREASVEFSCRVSGKFRSARNYHHSSPPITYLVIDVAKEKATPGQATIVDNVANLVAERLFVSHIRGVHLDNLQPQLVASQVRCRRLADPRRARDEHGPLPRWRIGCPRAATKGGAHGRQHCTVARIKRHVL